MREDVTYSQVIPCCREVVIANMGQSGDSFYLLVCYAHHHIGWDQGSTGECKLMYGDGKHDAPVLYPAGPSGSQFVFSSTSTAALSVAAFNSTTAIICYSMSEFGACNLLIRNNITLSNQNPLMHWSGNAKDKRRGSQEQADDWADQVWHALWLSLVSLGLSRSTIMLIL